MMYEQQRTARDFEELQRQLKLARERLSDLSWELEELELRLAPLQDQLEEGGAADPLVAREVDQLMQRRSHQEELILQQMLEIDQIKAEIAELRSAPLERQDERGAAA